MITNAQHFQITGVKFTCNNGRIRVYGAQNLTVVLSDCSFHGVGLYLSNINNATITRCNFSHYYPNTNNIDETGWPAAIIADSSLSQSTLLLIQCNFHNNDFALNFYTHRVRHSLHIRECAFVNNTSKYYNGIAGTVRVSYYHWYQYEEMQFLSVTDCTFSNNTVERGGGAVTIDITSNFFVTNYYNSVTLLLHSITDSIFINNTSQDRGGAVYIISNAHHVSVSVHMRQNVFFSNTAYFANGGAIHFNGRHSSFSLAAIGNSFIHNSAATFGALKIQFDHNNIVEIVNSSFYHNSAKGTVNLVVEQHVFIML